MVGPFPVEGLFGENYLIHFQCVGSNRKEARAVKAKSEALPACREMLSILLNIVKATREEGEELTFIIHCDNDSVFTADAFVTMVNFFGGRMHYGAPYDVRTCPHIECSGGLIVSALRSRLLDGRFPPKFWSVLVRTVVWVLNRIVGRDGLAPCEKFDKIEVSFKLLKTIPGALVYWHIDKCNRVFSKISLTGSTAVYIGPGEAFDESGQKVYTSDGRLLATPYVVADETVFPFEQGLRFMLARQIINSLDHVPEGLDPGSYVLSDGVDAWSLHGAGVSKTFWADDEHTSLRNFSGRVTNVRQDPANPKYILFRVQFEDDSVMLKTSRMTL